MIEGLKRIKIFPINSNVTLAVLYHEEINTYSSEDEDEVNNNESIFTADSDDDYEYEKECTNQLIPHPASTSITNSIFSL
jgi:hypothetical protein